MKILIVEDDEILSNTIKQCIEKKYDVELLMSYVRLLQLFKQNKNYYYKNRIRK